MRGPARRGWPVPLRIALAACLGLLLGLRLPVPTLQVGAALAALAGLAYLTWQADPAYTLSLGLVLSSISGNWDVLGLSSVLAPDRIVLFLGLVAIMLRAPGSRERPRLQFRGIHWLLLAAVLYAAISGAFAGTLDNIPSVAQLVERYGVIPFLVFLCAPVAFRTERDRRVLLVTLVAFGGYLGLTALFETLGLTALVFPKYINDPAIGINYGRARGPFVASASFGIALFTCAAACMMALQTLRSAAARATCVAVAVLCTLGLLFTLTRQVWVGSILGLVVASLVYAPLRRWLVPMVALGAASLALALAVVPGLSEEASSRRANVDSLWDRGNLNSAALRAVAEHPVVGIGWESWRAKNLLYFRQSPTYPLAPRVVDLPIHNIFLAYAAQIGIVGLVLWLGALLIGVGGTLLRRGPPELEPWRATGLAVFAFVLVVINFEPGQNFSNLVVWLLAGVVVAPRVLAKA